MDYAGIDKEDIPCFEQNRLIVETAGKGTGQDADDFHFPVPVEGHLIAGMPFFNVVERKGKIRGPVNPVLPVIQIVHGRLREKGK